MAKTFRYISTPLWNGKNLLLILIGLFAATGCKVNDDEIQILFVGDILLSRNVREEINARKTFPWENLQTLFNTADLVVGNLEGAVGDAKDVIFPEMASPVFDIEKTDMALLRNAGFGAITVENNHSLDLGENGKRTTMKYLKDHGIAAVSFDNSPRFITIKDVVVSILAINRIYNRDSTRNQIPSVEVKQKLQLARSLSNIVIVSIHWGSELLEWPNREQREIARWLIEHGADIIIGSHPHVVQKPEIIEDRPVFFSLGNHLFDQKYPATKMGLIADIRIANGKFRCLGIATRTGQNSFYPVISEHIDYDFKPTKFRKDPFIMNQYSLKPFSTGDDANKIILQAFQGKKKIWDSHPMPIVSIYPARLDGENEYLFTLEKHFSSLDGEVSLRPYVYSLDNKGVFARWRGSALAWPLLDARVSPHDQTILCALHRGDSFIVQDPNNETTRVATYKWNGFGFTGVSDSLACDHCQDLF
jgi:hypothetical protein